MSNLGSTIGMDPRSQKAGDFASKFLYDSEYDFAVKQAVRHQQSLEEVLEHSGIEKVWAQIQSSQNGNSGLSDSLEPVDSTSVKTGLLTVLPPEHLNGVEAESARARCQTRGCGVCPGVCQEAGQDANPDR